MHRHTHHDAVLNKHLAAPSDHRSIMAVWFTLSLARLHGLIIRLLIVGDVDKAFKLLNPCCINMSRIHIVYVLILCQRWSTCICFL